MNERNVDGLLDALAENWTTDVVELAKRLAARGVLVPASLTDEEVDGLPYHNSEYFGAFPAEDAATRVSFRAALERIAKGA